MSRIRIETNIAWDDKRKRYYVTLNYGKGGYITVIERLEKENV